MRQLKTSIFQDDYNQHKVNEKNYVDGKKYEDVPYRHLDDWFLCRCGKSENTRVALPALAGRMPRLELHGTLIPLKQSQPPIRIKIMNLRQYTVDSSLETRGLWIESPLAWYKLYRPSTVRVTMSDGFESSSQAELHLPLRAKFGMTSNLADLISVEKRFAQKHYTFRSPDELHRLLCPDEDTLAQNPGMMTEPFDLSLLRREPEFVKRALPKQEFGGSRFWKGLEEMRRDLVAAKREGEEWTLAQFNYLDSALESERRGRRLPWGDPDDQPRPNFHLKMLWDIHKPLPESESICEESEWDDDEQVIASGDEGRSDDEYATEEDGSSEDEGNKDREEDSVEESRPDEGHDSDVETFFRIPERHKDHLGTALDRRIAPCSTRLAPGVFLKEKRSRRKRRKTAALDIIEQERRKEKKAKIDSLKKLLQMRRAKNQDPASDISGAQLDYDSDEKLRETVVREFALDRDPGF